MKAIVASYLRRYWDSPTLTTWASLFARSANLVLVLPLATRRFPAEDVVVWQLFATIVTVQMLLDLGLTPTFSRLVAFAMGGAEDLSRPCAGNSSDAGTTSAANWLLVDRIWSTMRRLYGWSTGVAYVLLATFGTWALWKPVSAMKDPATGWLAWTVVCSMAPLAFLTMGSSAFLQGLGEVARLRRWEAITAAAGIASNLVVLLCGGGLVALMVVTQGWSIVNLLRNRTLIRSIAGGRLSDNRLGGIDSEVLATAWPAAWRSGIGVLITSGFVQLTGLAYAQLAPAAAASSYLIALRYIGAITQFSVAPFYSRLPLLARLYAAGRRVEMARCAERGMRISHWAYCAGVIIAAYGMPWLLRVSGNTALIPSPGLWWLLAFAFLGERFGAMHLQLYSVTNHILWHVVTLGSGSVTALTAAVLYPWLGLTAFPVAILAGYWGFYAWFCARLAYRAFQLPWLRFEARVSLPPGIALALIAGIELARSH